MSKEDRYSHLGDGADGDPDTSSNAHDANDTGRVASPDRQNEKEKGESSGDETGEDSPEDAGGISVTLSDGSRTVEVRVEDEGLTIDDLEDGIEDLFADLDEAPVDDSDDGGEPARSWTSDTTSIQSPMVRGMRASGPLTRAMIRSGSAGVAWMTAFLRYRRRDT